jgi:hypothetical protein
MSSVCLSISLSLLFKSLGKIRNEFLIKIEPTMLHTMLHSAR